MSNTESQHHVIPTSEETATFGCGHEGPVTYEHEFFGRKYQLRPEVLESRERCGQCRLDEVAPSMTQCSVCGKPIFKGEDCLNDKGKIICLSVKCSIGPIGIDPGVWNGERWVHGLEAGTIMIF